jgi:hypothetical protein
MLAHTAVVFTFVLIASVSTPAQDRNLSGAWALVAEAVKGESANGGTWSRSAISGTLQMEQSGATLTGTWTGPKGEAWPLAGRVESRRFEARTEARGTPVIIDGRQTTVPMRWTFRGSTDGNTMHGQMSLEREDADERDQLQPFTATRKR